MDLPVNPPIEPMLAALTEGMPTRDDLLFEPKWDGFRAIIFRDGDEVLIQSRDKKSMNRYFPELEEPLRRALPERCVVDGEIILVGDSGLEFEMLQHRIHPAKSRVEMLAKATPVSFVAFDLLAEGDESLMARPQAERRARLEAAISARSGPVMVTPATRDPKVAERWFHDLEGAGLDGVIAKPLDLGYLPKKRALIKIKHVRTADCAVAGFRWHKNGPGTHVGSLLLGLYDDSGVLHHVGVTSSFNAAMREKLVAELAPLRENALDEHPWKAWAIADEHAERRMPGAKSRWSAGKDLSWEPLRVERVVEVKYDFMQGDRFRHATTFLRWRHDKAPRDCTYDQLSRPEPMNLREFLAVR